MVEGSALHTIDQFMWGYQTHFRANIRFLANQVLERIGAGEEAHALLVGSLMPTARARHLVCVEPEDGSLSQAPFEGMAQEIEDAIPLDERQNMFYGDEATMRDKPENIRRAVTRDKIAERLADYDPQHGLKSFCGGVYPVEGYYVCPVIQISTKLIKRFPAIEFEETDRWTPTRLSFLESCIWAVLGEAQSALVAPEPGRTRWDSMRSAEEVVARAAGNFMQGISAIVGRWEGVDLLQAFNGVAALKYEGTDVSGRIVLANRDIQTPAPAPDFLFRFSEPVHLSKTRWARKLLQLGSDPASLIANVNAIYGVITNPDVVAMETDRTFSVTFPADRQWTISYRSQPLLTVDAGAAQLPSEAISFERFYTLGVLKEVEAMLGSPLARHFDLIFGTSTGAIIAALLGLGRTVDEVHDLYCKHVVKIMKAKSPSDKSAALGALAKEVFGAAKFTDMKTGVGIVTTNWVLQKPMIFKSRPGQAHGMKASFAPGFGCTVAEAVVASASAFPFFTRQTVKTSQGDTVELADGGYCANNPTLYAIADATEALARAKSDVRVVSVGVGVYPKPPVRMMSKGWWGKLLVGADLIDKTFEINTQSMEQLRAVLFSDVPSVRISETFSEPEMATDLFEHDLKKLNVLRQRGRDSFARHEVELRRLLAVAAS